MAMPSSSAWAYFADKLKPAPTAAETWYRIRGEAFDDEKLDEGSDLGFGYSPGALAPLESGVSLCDGCEVEQEATKNTGPLAAGGGKRLGCYSSQQ
jgi:hypothetical protein